MSFLQENNSSNLSARITNKGRKKIAEGNFTINYFQIGDSEFDYNFSNYDGNLNSSQKVIAPLDKDSQVRYPYKISESVITGTTYGIPVKTSHTDIVTNNMAAAGYVSEYVDFDVETGYGTTVKTDYQEIDIIRLN